MGRKIRFSRFSAPRRSKFHAYMNIVSILPEYALILKSIEDKRNKQQSNRAMSHESMEDEEEERKQEWGGE